MGPPTSAANLASTLAFVEGIAARCEEQFPRECPACNRRYGSFEEFLEATEAFGYPTEFDPAPDDPFGVIVFSSCHCATTLSTRWEGPPGDERLAFRRAIAEDARNLSIRPADVLLRLRAALHEHVLGGDTVAKGGGDGG